MKNLKLLALLVFIILCLSPQIAHSAESDAPIVIENEFVLSAGGVSDGEFIWTIPNEAGAFSKINIQTGIKENLSKYADFNELNSLSGYMTGAFHNKENGEKFLYLVPYEVGKPFVRINLDTLKMDYPFRNVGFYFGSCHITKEEGNDYLWLIPSKIKPVGSKTETEIVKLNLTEGKKEHSIAAKIDNKYFAFSGSLNVGESIWLLPKEEGQPLMKMDVNSTKGSLESEAVKKIYSGKNLNFSKIPTAVFDGNCIWFLCENISFALNNCVVVKCDINGNYIDRFELSKDRFVASAVNKGDIYFFSGGEGKKPFGVKIEGENDVITAFELYEKKGYIPFATLPINGGESGVYIIPNTTNGKKMPILKLLERPVLDVTAISTEKEYREYGDISKGYALNIAFNTPDGYKPERLYWFASEEPHKYENEITFFKKYEEADSSEKFSEKIKSLNNLTVLAKKNGNYNFLMEYTSSDNENYLYANGEQIVDKIYEKIPIKITRYNIEDGGVDAIIETVTHLKDFGAAMSLDGSEFIKCDAPMELFPAKEVFANGGEWELEAPASYVISIGDESITPDNFFAEFDFSYKPKMSEALDENSLVDSKEDNKEYHASNYESERAVMVPHFFDDSDEAIASEPTELSEAVESGPLTDDKGDNKLIE